jgi:hypothetical protein
MITSPGYILTAHFIGCVGNEFYDSITDFITPGGQARLSHSSDQGIIQKQESKYQLTYSTDQWAESIRTLQNRRNS